MRPADTKSGRMLQRNGAPMPLKLNTTTLDNGGSKNLDIPAQPKSHTSRINHPLFSSTFDFAGSSAVPSPPPSAGLPSHARPRGPRSKSPSTRNSMIEDEDSEWDATKELPHFQPAIRRSSLLTPPTTSDSRRQSYDRTTHLGYDDGSTDMLPAGRRSSVPTHHLRSEPSPERQIHAGFRRSSLATTSVTRQDVENEKLNEVDVLSEVDSIEEEPAADNTNTDMDGIQADTAELTLEDSTPLAASLKRESEEADPNVSSSVKTPIPNPFISLRHVPPPYILEQLLYLGPQFVGHEPTAQVYVEAVPMDEKSQAYKVEIVPRDTTSNPFRLVKRHKFHDSSDESDGTPPPDSPVTPHGLDEDDVEYTSPKLPIHVEYAVFRLPLLGSMLLSGQVFCGDTLRMPLPYPEVWTAVVGWMYTNKVVRLPGMDLDEQAEMVRYCIEFLGGRV
jgi:hypothetical protein